MNEDQIYCYDMLCDLFKGEQRIIGKVKPSGSTNGIMINTTSSMWATFDYDGLTRAVVMAHDRAIRFEIQSSGPNMLKLLLHRRGKKGAMYERHPTMQEALNNILSKADER